MLACASKRQAPHEASNMFREKSTLQEQRPSRAGGRDTVLHGASPARTTQTCCQREAWPQTVKIQRCRVSNFVPKRDWHVISSIVAVELDLPVA